MHTHTQKERERERGEWAKEKARDLRLERVMRGWCGDMIWWIEKYWTIPICSWRWYDDIIGRGEGEKVRDERENKFSEKGVGEDSINWTAYVCIEAWFEIGS
jgi:hypothetical protein